LQLLAFPFRHECLPSASSCARTDVNGDCTRLALAQRAAPHSTIRSHQAGLYCHGGLGAVQGSKTRGGAVTKTTIGTSAAKRLVALVPTDIALIPKVETIPRKRGFSAAPGAIARVASQAGHLSCRGL
jgi:hypothetical protein